MTNILLRDSPVEVTMVILVDKQQPEEDNGMVDEGTFYCWLEHPSSDNESQTYTWRLFKIVKMDEIILNSVAW